MTGNGRPNLYFQGLLAFAPSIASQGRFFAPIGDAGDAGVSAVDVRDIAAVSWRITRTLRVARTLPSIVQATPGCWVLKPRRIPHTMWNAGSEPARIIELYTPGGFELFFRDFGDRLRQGPVGLDELNRVAQVRPSAAAGRSRGNAGRSAIVAPSAPTGHRIVGSPSRAGHPYTKRPR